MVDEESKKTGAKDKPEALDQVDSAKESSKKRFSLYSKKAEEEVKPVEKEEVKPVEPEAKKEESGKADSVDDSSKTDSAIEPSKKKGFSLFSKKPEVTAKPTVFLHPVPEDAEIINSYWVNEPYAKICIVSVPSLGGALAYYIVEAQLADFERIAFAKLLDILSKELQPPKTTEIDAKLHVIQEAKRIALKYRRSLGTFSEEAWSKILYYIERDLIGFGPIHAMMLDPNIEDISANGVNLPFYIWHRKYESLPTNLFVTEKETLDNLIVKLAHLSGKHISTAFPVLDAMLPGKHRIATTYKEEVSPKGSTFSIRKFKEEPFSVVDLIKLGTINETLAAYFWMLLENRTTVVVIGGTGAGKTSTLNALASLAKPSMKIVTVEEIPELNLPRDNWVQLVSRESYGLGSVKTGEVTLFQLVKTSLRYRPDYLVIGEVRGEEAFVLFQAMATGHGGMCTLHAENLDYAIKRLRSSPMNVAETYIPLMNVAAIVERVQLPKKSLAGLSFGRRMRNVFEIEDFDVYHPIAEWDPINDVLNTNLDGSIMLRHIGEKTGKSFAEIIVEVKRRATVIQWLRETDVSESHEVVRVIAQYYVKPAAIEKIALAELQARTVQPSPSQPSIAKPSRRS
ncbi:MAG TPA: type II/IV secretion system ATPase subunit [Nitrososphaerales archaeon]